MTTKDQKGNDSTLLSKARRKKENLIRIEEKLRQTESNQLFFSSFLSCLNRSHDLRQTLLEIMELIKAHAGVSAVAVRLRRGEDFPYFLQMGFPSRYVEAENMLCERTREGIPFRDLSGQIILKGLSGLVLQGRLDPTKSWFTRGGSFWTNNYSALPASLTKVDHQEVKRRCYQGQEFQSMTLIPLRSNHDIIGLLQMNDRRPGCFTKEMIHFYEKISNSIALTMNHRILEEALARSSQEWTATFDALMDLIILIDSRQHIQRCNRAFAEFVGLPFQKIISRRCCEVLPDSTESPTDPIGTETLESKSRQISELEVGRRVFRVTTDPILDSQGSLTGAVRVFSDITARKRAEEDLLKVSRELAIRNSIRKVLLTTSKDVMYHQILSIILEVSENPYGIFGYLNEEGSLVVPTFTASVWDECQIRGKTHIFPAVTWGESSWSRALREKRTFRQNTVSTLIPPGHVPIIRHVSMPLIHQDQVVGLILVANKERDYTQDDVDLLKTMADIIAPVLLARLEADRQEKERRRVETALIRAEENYRSIVENAIEGIFQSSPDGRFLMANTAVAKFHGYDSPAELIASITDIRNQLYVVAEDRDIYRHLLETKGVVKGFEARFYKKDGAIGWGSMNVRSVKNKEGKLLYYEGTIEDITLRKEAETARDQNLKRLRKALEGMVGTLALVSETRDPYTAGHQRRVADLARTISREIGLPAEQEEGIRMAGLIHDLGKIAIPAEILSTPRQLTKIELSLIQTHPQVAYDILKDIEFPWPLAQIVREHHERMDGSGYPQGLRGDEILLEARILAVADVVEAIASHRPYRPALGVDKALEEISEHKGLFYDPVVVESCLRLFKEKGFKWE